MTRTSFFLTALLLSACGGEIDEAAQPAACSSGTPQATVPWFLAGADPRDYAIATDSAVTQSGAPTERLAATVRAPKDFGTVMQTLPATPILGKRLTFQAAVKTSGIANRAGLWMRVDGNTPNSPLAFSNMDDHPLVGSQDWTLEEVTLDVAPEAQSISFGLWLGGAGEVWLDQVTLVSCESVPANSAGSLSTP